MPEAGYIKLYRKFRSNGLWTERRTFSRAEAWLDLLMDAHYGQDPRQQGVGLTTVEVRRGEVVGSLRYWGGRWGWSKSRVARFIEMLKQRDMVRDAGRSDTGTPGGTASGTAAGHLRLVHYERYNPPRDTSGTASGTPTGTAAGQERDRSGTNLRREESKTQGAPPLPPPHAAQAPPAPEPEAVPDADAEPGVDYHLAAKLGRMVRDRHQVRVTEKTVAAYVPQIRALRVDHGIEAPRMVAVMEMYRSNGGGGYWTVRNGADFLRYFLKLEAFFSTQRGRGSHRDVPDRSLFDLPEEVPTQ